MNGRQWVKNHLFKNSPDDGGDGGFGLHGWLARLHTAPIQQIDGLEITPLILEGAAGKPFLLAPEAIDRGLLEIAERGSYALASIKAAFNARHGGVSGLSRMAHDLLLRPYLATQESEELSKSFAERRKPDAGTFGR